MRKLVILDRDGVINHDSEEYIKSPEEWRPIPGSLEAIVKLHQAGYLVAVATNQSGIARQFFTRETLQEIHQSMQQQVAALGGHIDAVFFCPHAPIDACECRKPKPGLIYQALKHFQLNPNQTNIFVIGDSLRDLEAAKSAGCAPILVLTGNGKKTQLTLPADFNGVSTYQNLAEAAEALLKSEPQ